LVVGAHPDDTDFGAGGTVALWSQLDWEFHYLVLTNGAKGTGDREMTRDRLVPLREQEQEACATVLGVTSCTFLGGEDGELDYSRPMLGNIVREIRRLKPYAIFTHTPNIIHRRATPARTEGELAEYEGFINHRDHRNTGTMAIDAVYPTARDHLNFPEHLTDEGLETHHVREVYIWGDNNPNFAVDITDVLDTKIEALLKHDSQFGDRGDMFAEHIRTRWGDADGRYYERFDRLVLPL
jgi:LmbE family N-acetylglucosaminyl deacetylase